LVLNYLSYEDTIRYYKAIKRFAEIIENSENELWFRLKEGELLFFDNFRTMHGRSQFDGERKLLTAYVPRDDWISKSAVFKIIEA
jgi:trimethyllysine dioxygenase